MRMGDLSVWRLRSSVVGVLFALRACVCAVRAAWCCSFQCERVVSKKGGRNDRRLWSLRTAALVAPLRPDRCWRLSQTMVDTIVTGLYQLLKIGTPRFAQTIKTPFDSNRCVSSLCGSSQKGLPIRTGRKSSAHELNLARSGTGALNDGHFGGPLADQGVHGRPKQPGAMCYPPCRRYCGGDCD